MAAAGSPIEGSGETATSDSRRRCSSRRACNTTLLQNSGGTSSSDRRADTPRHETAAPHRPRRGATNKGRRPTATASPDSRSGRALALAAKAAFLRALGPVRALISYVAHVLRKMIPHVVRWARTAVDLVSGAVRFLQDVLVRAGHLAFQAIRHMSSVIAQAYTLIAPAMWRLARSVASVLGRPLKAAYRSIRTVSHAISRGLSRALEATRQVLSVGWRTLGRVMAPILRSIATGLDCCGDWRSKSAGTFLDNAHRSEETRCQPLAMGASFYRRRTQVGPTPLHADEHCCTPGPPAVRTTSCCWRAVG